MGKYLYLASGMACSFCWISHSTNHMVDMLAKWRAKHLMFFVGEVVSLIIDIFFFLEPLLV